MRNMKKTNYESVLRYFDQYDEWNRLFKDGFHQLEWIVTFHHLNRFLPPKSKILDVGGGPGRHLFELAERGHKTTLLDLSPRMIKLAREKSSKKSLSVQQNLYGFVEGSITNLCFEDEKFDVILALHPLSYLIIYEDRKNAMCELKRVLKPRGLLVIGAINRYGRIRNLLKNRPELIFLPQYEGILTSGTHLAHDNNPDNYLFTPIELQKWIENYGFETLDLASSEGLSGGLREGTNLISQTPEHWERWIQFIIETSNDPSIWGCAEHFIYFGVKT